MTATLILALMVGALAQAPAAATGSSAENGKAFWDSPRTACRQCHGNAGEGGFGPDLAGRGLSADEFKRAVRKPWGVMPAYTDEQVNDQAVADLTAYFAGLPKVAQTGAPRYTAPAGAPTGQHLATDAYGCTLCHNPEFAVARRSLGGEAGTANFALFTKLVYQHTDDYPMGRMGNYSRDRLPEATLQQIFDYILALGLRVPVTATGTLATSDGAYTYAVTVKNTGRKMRGGLAAEDLTISLALPAGATVTNTTGLNYQGVTHDPKGDAAVWTLPRLGPEETQAFSVTLMGGTAASGLQQGSVVRWAKPLLRGNPAAPKLTLKDPSIPETGDQVNISFPAAQR
jgi:cytochrome c551/cytochrome c550